MNLNVLVRGQSNAFAMMDRNGGAGVRDLPDGVARLLGFDGVNDTVSLVYDAQDWGSGTVFGGTALLGDWLGGSIGNWSVAGLERALLNEIGALPATQRDDPTATLWLHSEYDSRDTSLTAPEWVSAVRFDAAEVRAALGQGAATTPYLFVSAMPYARGSDSGHQVIREGMEALVRDPGFNARIAARMLDTDIAHDDYDGDPATREYGGEHMDGGDAAQTIARAVRAIAEAFAPYAKPGSPVDLARGSLADEGPEVISAVRVAANQLRLDVRHDAASHFAALDPEAAGGMGWSVIGTTRVNGSAVQILDADTLLVTFSGALPADGELFYGYGYGRLATTGEPGRGNAVYDDQGLPIWVRADGLALDGSYATLPPGPAQTTTGTPVAVSVGAGPDALVLRIAQDAYLGNAQYVVRVDGVQIGGTLTASALRSNGQADQVTVRGDWAAGAHRVEVQFLNDVWHGTPQADRNLYLEGASYAGAALSGAALGATVDGTASFAFTETTSATPPPASEPVTQPTGTEATQPLPMPPPVQAAAVTAPGGNTVLWQHELGYVAAWRMNADAIAERGQAPINPGPAWTVIGAGDLNGDGKQDLVWRGPSGEVAVWQMDGAAILAGANASLNPGSAWTVAAIGDLNGDGRDDLVWRGPSGQVAIWEMNGAAILGGADVSLNPGGSWTIAAIGDLNGDGRDDLVWRGPSGQVAIWEMNGSAITGGGQVALNPGLAWTVERTADLDGDGRDGILWRGPSGEVATWEMNGAAIAMAAQVAFNPGGSWAVADAGDYGGDGRDDVLWRGPSGEVAIWEMNGAAIAASGQVALNPGLAWEVIA